MDRGLRISIHQGDGFRGGIGARIRKYGRRVQLGPGPLRLGWPKLRVQGRGDAENRYQHQSLEQWLSSKKYRPITLLFLTCIPGARFPIPRYGRAWVLYWPSTR